MGARLLAATALEYLELGMNIDFIRVDEDGLGETSDGVRSIDDAGRIGMASQAIQLEWLIDSIGQEPALRQTLTNWQQTAESSSSGRLGRPFQDHRRVMDGIVYRYRAGIPWRDLPEVFGPWQTVWKRHRRFSGDGTWNSILARLLSEADAVGKIVWEVSVDFDGDSGASTRDESSAHHGGIVELHESAGRAS